MSATAAGRQLTESHRLAQARLGALTVLALRDVWPLLDPADLTGSTPGWLRTVAQIIRRQRAISAALAAAYVTTLRAVELGRLEPSYTATLAAEVAPEAIAVSMAVTGPVALRSAFARAVPQAVALRNAETSSAAAGMRHALNGGRETILTSVDADGSAKGYQRVTSSSCCAFCGALAIRGPVYRSAGAVDFHAHDSCTCTAEPVYSDDATLPANSQRLRAIYNDATAALEPGDTPLNAFRRALAGTAP